MLSDKKLKQISKRRKVSVEQLAEQIVRAGLDKRTAVSAVKNWQKGLFKPEPRSEDVKRLASVLGIEVNELSGWRSSYRYAPMSVQGKIGNAVDSRASGAGCAGYPEIHSQACRGNGDKNPAGRDCRC